ncbi:DUF6082 family protein [Actinoplanes sp. NPDC048988]|uniref:DUF6082 family protein n=1 Tax=Actinoplanes sp. NPDC048988 TaxID=3363901 RepID=UPI00371B4FDE
MTTSLAPLPRVPRRLGGWLIVGSLCVTFIATIVAFPLLIQGLVNDRDWRLLSDAGQAYGGISAIVAGLGLCGIAASVALQVRQTRLAQAISARERHFELVKLGLENPALSYQVGDETIETYKKKVLINLWVSHWLLVWDIGEADERFLHAALDDLFKESAAREWWRQRGESFSMLDTRRHRQFMTIVSRCHTAAERAAQVAPPAPDHGNAA